MGVTDISWNEKDIVMDHLTSVVEENRTFS